ANFLDSGNFSASTITNDTFSFSPESFLNFGFIIRQFPHQLAENWTITVSLFSTTSFKLSVLSSCNILFFKKIMKKKRRFSLLFLIRGKLILRQVRSNSIACCVHSLFSFFPVRWADLAVFLHVRVGVD